MKAKTIQELIAETPDNVIDEVERHVRKLRPHFAGVHPVIASAVLADLTATYLAGFITSGPDGIDQAATDDQRERLLDAFMVLVRNLLDHNQPKIK